MLKKNAKKNAFKFYCEKCDYYSNNRYDYNKHIQTRKHNAKNANCDAIPKNVYKCPCGKTYKQQPSLSRHKKKCAYIHQTNNTTEQSQNTQDSTLASLLIEILETNKDLKEQIVDLASKPRTINNNTNNSFNLNNFLNVQCKDAMNLSDFLKTIQYTFNDLLYLGEQGFVKSVQNTFVKQLGDMDQTKRPIHCTDKKRKTMYVKDEDKWEKDDDNNKISSAIKTINKKQLSAFTQHSKERPTDYLDSDANLQTQNNIIQEMCGYTKETSTETNEKILRNISTKLHIDK